MLGYIFVLLVVASIKAAPDKGWEDVFKDIGSSSITFNTGSNKRYLIVDLPLNFMEAMDFCENIHMNLLTIESSKEHEAVKKFIQDAKKVKEFWTSGSRLMDKSTWLWLTTGNNFTYTAWNKGEPTGKDEFCVNMQSNFLWNDVLCTAKQNVICERPLDEVREDSNPDEKYWATVFTEKKNTPNLDLLHFQGKDYYFTREYTATYLDALEFCLAINMKLVTIRSKEENERLYRHIRDTMGGKVWWTAGTRLLDDNNWVWLTDGSPIDYTNWEKSNPSSGTERCLNLMYDKDTGLLWNDIDCNAELKVICEKVTENVPVEIDDDAEFLRKLEETEPGSISKYTVDGRQFHVSKKVLATHFQASAFCEYHHMKLLEIQNAEENAQLTNILPFPVVNGPYWINGEKINEQWRWKSSNTPVSYYNWEEGHPQQGECLGISTYGKYKDWDCKAKKYFICEDEKQTPNDNGDALVTLFMLNNLISKEGKEVKAAQLIASQYAKVNPEGGYHVTVDNEI